MNGTENRAGLFVICTEVEAATFNAIQFMFADVFVYYLVQNKQKRKTENCMCITIWHPHSTCIHIWYMKNESKKKQ